MFNHTHPCGVWVVVQQGLVWRSPVSAGCRVTTNLLPTCFQHASSLAQSPNWIHVGSMPEASWNQVVKRYIAATGLRQQRPCPTLAHKPLNHPRLSRDDLFFSSPPQPSPPPPPPPPPHAWRDFQTKVFAPSRWQCFQSQHGSKADINMYLLQFRQSAFNPCRQHAYIRRLVVNGIVPSTGWTLETHKHYVTP
jgi:hypothetical protein